ncbi:MAG: DedA family protein [Planctomycetes bacterium]|nr:DedA family protein [Planctomycetota bacterium]
MIDWIESVLRLNVDLIAKGGYAGIFLLMTIESSFIPFPSEVVVPPAGYLAARGEMSALWVMVASILGSLAGAYVNYALAVKVGRPFFHRYGKWFLVSERNLDRAEAFFARHGEMGTFVGRLLPAIRQLVSIPAGMARMHLGRFTLFTALGAGIWCAVLLGIGWSVGKAGERLDLHEVKDQAGRVFLAWILPALVLVVAGYVIWRRRRREPPSPGGPTVSDSGP